MRMRESTKMGQETIEGGTKSPSFPVATKDSASGVKSRSVREKMSLFTKEWAVDDPPPTVSKQENGMPSLRVNWQLKTIWPVAVVLLVGMLLFLLSTLS